jgi:hypothetical protein
LVLETLPEALPEANLEALSEATLVVDLGLEGGDSLPLPLLPLLEVTLFSSKPVMVEDVKDVEV